jgi:hypothetical protein
MKLAELIQTPGWYPESDTRFSEDERDEILRSLKKRFKILKGKKRVYLSENCDVTRIQFELADSGLIVLSGVYSDGWIINTETLQLEKLLNPKGSLWQDVKYYENYSE